MALGHDDRLVVSSLVGPDKIPTEEPRLNYAHPLEANQYVVKLF